jgi:large repetitive protein
MSRMSHNPSSWWNDKLAGLLAGALRPAHATKSPKRRTLRVERLENRALLSVTVLPSISGTIVHNMSQSGLVGTNTPLAGVTVKLYRDGGNSHFDGTSGGDDQLVTSTTTDSAGKYTFKNLAVGTYYVQQSAASGLAIASGQDVGTVTITSNDTQGVQGTVIDSFDTTTQGIIASRFNGRSDSSSLVAPEALGGHRELFTQLNSTSGSLSLGANDYIPGVLDCASGAASNGTFQVIWDGTATNPKAANPTGLNHVDLTQSGANTAIQFVVGADHDNASLVLKVYTDANNWSQATVPITNTGDGSATQAVNIPFSSFTVGAGSGANFANVGAVQLNINGVAAVDAEIGSISAIGPKVLTSNLAQISQVDVGIVKSATPNPATAGKQLTYTLTVTNNGPSSATGVSVVDTLPAGVTYVSATPNQGTSSFANGIITTSVGSLASGASTSITILVTVNPGATGSITNTAVVSENEPDTDPTNNKATVTTQINTLIDLAITKTASLNEVKPGGQLVYTLTTINNGPSNATGVIILDPLPAGESYVSATTSQGTTSYSGGVLTVNLGNLASGASATTTFTVMVSSSATGTVTNTATVKGNESETTMANNQASITTPVATVVVPHGTPTPTPTLSKRMFLGR